MSGDKTPASDLNTTTTYYYCTTQCGLVILELHTKLKERAQCTAIVLISIPYVWIVIPDDDNLNIATVYCQQNFPNILLCTDRGVSLEVNSQILEVLTKIYATL